VRNARRDGPARSGVCLSRRGVHARNAGRRRGTGREATGHDEVLRLCDGRQRRVGLAEHQVEVAGAEGTQRLRARGGEDGPGRGGCQGGHGGGGGEHG